MSDEEPRPAQEPPHQPNWGSAYPPPPGYGYGYPMYYAPPPPKHDKATTAMVLGIVSVAGGFLCYGLPLFVAPFAWYQGRKAVREIDASQGRLSGRSEAKAGLVLGIVGTVLLALALAVITLFVVLAVTLDDFSFDAGYDDSDPSDSFDTTAPLIYSEQPTSTGSLTSVMP